MGGGVFGAVVATRLRPSGASVALAPNEAATRARDGRTSVTVRNECIRGATSIGLLAEYDVDYTESSMGAYRSRQVYSFTCSLTERTCTGAILQLDHVDKALPLTFFDLGSAQEARVVSIVGDVATLQWGPLRQFVIDFARGETTFTESGPGTNGRGSARCD